MTKHIYYKTGDKNAPDYIKDSNGEVVLAMCKRCNKVEIQLREPCILTKLEARIEKAKKIVSDHEFFMVVIESNLLKDTKVFFITERGCGMNPPKPTILDRLLNIFAGDNK